MVRIAGTLRRHIPCVCAASAWLAYVTMTALGIRLGADDMGRLISMSVVTLSVWAMLRFRDLKPQPGGDGRWITIEELAGMEAAMLSGLLAGQGEPPQEPARILHSA
jgi:hypothetical protein